MEHFLVQSPHISRGQILVTYVQLRRKGISREEAIEKVRPAANQLADEERNELGNDVNEWENTHQVPQQNSQYELLPSPPWKRSEPTTVLPTVNAIAASTASVPSDSSFIKPLTPLKNTPVLDESHLPQLCPKCGKKNTTSAPHCYSCGTILQSAHIATKRINKPDQGTAILKDQPRVFLSIKGRKQPLEVYLRQEMIIGRSSPDHSLKPNIDLAAYDGENLGVSRAHVSLKMQDDTIVITDLKSSNHTYINGQRLYAHETRVLRHGDEIRLGRLVIKVLFKI
jgi:hypothetical protein